MHVACKCQAAGQQNGREVYKRASKHGSNGKMMEKMLKGGGSSAKLQRGWGECEEKAENHVSSVGMYHSWHHLLLSGYTCLPQERCTWGCCQSCSRQLSDGGRTKVGHPKCCDLTSSAASGLSQRALPLLSLPLLSGLLPPPLQPLRLRHAHGVICGGFPLPSTSPLALFL